MFLPIHDDEPHHVIRFQWVSGGLMLANLLVFLGLRYGLGEGGENLISARYGLTPSFFLGTGPVPDGLNPIFPPLTLLTYSFLHGGWAHLITNLLFIWVFADNVEDAFGRFSFLVFYFTCAAVAGLSHVLQMPLSAEPVVGSSGAVAGILAAYMVLFPRARVWVLLFLRIPVRLPAWILLASWIGMQLLALALAEKGDAPIAWAAHVGGFACGLVITFWLRKRLFSPKSP